MTTTELTYEQAVSAHVGWASDLMEFDIKCARQVIESAAQSIAGYASHLAEMARNADQPDLLAHYASVIAKDAMQMMAMAQYAKGISVAQTRLNGEG